LAAQLKPDAGHLMLQHEDARLVLDPAHGGVIREFSCLGREVLRRALPGETDPMAAASFPMVPYANRIADGSFRSGEHSVRLQANWTSDPNPLHGQGWRQPWRIVECSGTDATLEFYGGGDEWPWRYRAEQHFRLSRTALSVRLSVENLADSPMPAVLGLHPYFADAARARLQAHTPLVWTMDASSLPVAQVPTPAGWSFADGRPVGALPLDHCFAGWDGVAVLSWPEFTLQLRATNCSYLHVFVPRGASFFCAEPQTAPIGALSRERNEAAMVQPRQRYAIQVSFDVEAA
jgi:aldose 1-epimerase